MVLLRLSDRAIGLVSLAVLTRLLAPSDFGAVAIATAVLAMVEAFGQFGLDLALIRGENRDRSAYDSAWTINLGIGLIVAAILAGLAIPAPAFFDDARLAPIFLWLALSVAIGGFENIGIVAFRKELAFDREFRFLLSGRVLGTAVAIAGAVAWGDYRALVAGVVARRIASVALSYTMHPFRPRLSLAGLGSLMQFSAWVMVQTILATVNHRLPALLIGRWIGTSQVAFFTVAYEVATLATSEIMAPIRRVLYPAYAQIEADRQRFAVVIVNSLGVMALIGLPVAAGLALIATDVVHVMFGAQWLEAVPLVRIPRDRRRNSVPRHVKPSGLSRARDTAVHGAPRAGPFRLLRAAGRARSGLGRRGRSGLGLCRGIGDRARRGLCARHARGQAARDTDRSGAFAAAGGHRADDPRGSAGTGRAALGRRSGVVADADGRFGGRRRDGLCRDGRCALARFRTTRFSRRKDRRAAARIAGRDRAPPEALSTGAHPPTRPSSAARSSRARYLAPVISTERIQ